MSSKKKTPLFFSFSFRVLLIISASALLISYISIFINPAKVSFPLLFGLYFIPIAIFNLILLIIALIKRSKSALIPAIILLPAIFLINLFYIPGKSEESDIIVNKGDIRIMSWNVAKFAAAKGDSDEKSTKRSVLSLIRKHSPEIVCLQEYSVNDTSDINRDFPDYKYRRWHLFRLRNNTLFGNLTLSKFPITESDYLGFKGSTNLSIYCDILVDTTTIRLFNTHLESYNISFTGLVKRDNRERKSLSGQITEVHDKVIDANVRRVEQVDRVLSEISRYDGLSVICGDFNDTPVSYTYHRLSKNLNDSFLEAGKGLSATYRILWPMLRIDYILLPKSFEVKDHKTIRSELSDHYPVVSLFRI